MIHGGFLQEDGLWIPNQFTIIGIQQVLMAAFWSQPFDWFVGLCAHNQADSVALSLVEEPGATNGYARQHLQGNSSNWPTIGMINGESYVESRPFSFPTTGNYDKATNRMFLTDGAQVIAISTPRPDGLQYIPPPDNTVYRLYFR